MWSTDAPYHGPAHAPKSHVYEGYQHRRNKRIERWRRLRRFAFGTLLLAAAIRLGIGFVPEPPPWPNRDQRVTALDALVERTLLSEGTTGTPAPPVPSQVRATALALREFLADFPNSSHAPKFHRHLARALDALSPDYHEAAAREFRPAVQQASTAAVRSARGCWTRCTTPGSTSTQARRPLATWTGMGRQTWCSSAAPASALRTASGSSADARHPSADARRPRTDAQPLTSCTT